MEKRHEQLVCTELSYTKARAHIQHKYTDYLFKLECGPLPNLMVALPNVAGALCSTPQSLADAHY